MGLIRVGIDAKTVGILIHIYQEYLDKAVSLEFLQKT